MFAEEGHTFGCADRIVLCIWGSAGTGSKPLAESLPDQRCFGDSFLGGNTYYSLLAMLEGPHFTKKQIPICKSASELHPYPAGGI